MTRCGLLVTKLNELKERPGYIIWLKCYNVQKFLNQVRNAVGSDGLKTPYGEMIDIILDNKNKNSTKLYKYIYTYEHIVSNISNNISNINI